MSRNFAAKEPLRILVVIPTLKDDPLDTINHLVRQTLKPCRIIVAAALRKVHERMIDFTSRVRETPPIDVFIVKPDMNEHVGVRVGKAINTVLAAYDITKYTHIVKIDADVKLPIDYLENCLRTNADVIGLGPFMMIKIKPFLMLLNGRWPETPGDDAYVCLRFLSQGFKVARWPDGIKVRVGGAFGDWRYYYLRGIDDFRMGMEPFHETRNVIHLIKSRHNLLPFFSLIGYLIALVKKEDFYEFAPIIFRRAFRG
ncbi:MAG: glycosyltransferase family A protein [Candidatus Bathyarchaeia archaeon]